ncbi:MFS transporter [Lactobacillus sp. CBA3605]|uniref:DHA2 family efflux MFS transporter permease subunit n=1 Tax=Lactobacillus sp. CBA3605 TaxID=2099788 RepID=UPI000CFB0264|nr:DHA2 family efflux MFS transporter permease subunit [Lactobacillus sp. CBA3605]AVK61717.1 MFS transporter [Lactobacillus sp. CBA3605]
MTKKQRFILTITLLVAVFTALLNQTVMVTALPVMMQQFSIKLTTAQWLTTGYVLVLGIATPISALLYERFSTRHLFITLIISFIVATLVGASGVNFAMVLIARLCQAAMGGILMTFSQIALLGLYSPQQRGTILGLFSMVVSAGPAIGPTFAGILLAHFTWHSLFWVVLVVMVLILGLGWRFLPDLQAGQPIKFDWVAIGLLVTGMGLLLIGISTLQTNWQWGLGLLLVGVFLTAGFVRQQLSTTQPILNLRLFKNATFTRMTLAVMLTFAVMMGTETLLPVLLETHRGLSSMQTGLVMLPGALANVILAPLVGRWYDQHGLEKIMMIGLALTLVASGWFYFITAETPVVFIILAYALRMSGSAMIISVTVAQALAPLAGRELSHGTALNNAVRQIAGSLGNTVLIWAVNSQANFNGGFQLAMGVTIVAALGLVWLGISEIRAIKAVANQ